MSRIDVDARAPGDRLAGALFIAFPLLVQLPYATLVARFDYPDVLRRPAGEVLAAFHAGAPGLALTWYAYAMSIGVFVAAVLAFDRGDARRRTATWLAMASALVQWIALARWTFAVPALAAAHAQGDAALRGAAELDYLLLNALLGMGVGEHLGQLLMAAWTLAMLPLLPRLAWPLRALGALSALAFLAGLGETLGAAIGVDGSALGWIPPTAFLAWSVWLIAVGVALLRR
jgi:hypothetical protein